MILGKSPLKNDSLLSLKIFEENTNYTSPLFNLKTSTKTTIDIEELYHKLKTDSVKEEVIECIKNKTYEYSFSVPAGVNCSINDLDIYFHFRSVVGNNNAVSFKRCGKGIDFHEVNFHFLLN